MNSKNVLQAGNKKLPKSTGIFNIPAGSTCPGKTSYCAKYCYACKAARLYPQVPAYRAKMLELSLRDDFISVIIDEVKRRKFPVIRIHESGDFYNQKYLDKWINIAKALPDVIFYAYTKSHWLDFGDSFTRPKNFIVRNSLDPSSNAAAEGSSVKFDGSAYTIEKGGEVEGLLCPGDCRTCDYCYVPSKIRKDVTFIRH